MIRKKQWGRTFTAALAAALLLLAAACGTAGVPAAASSGGEAASLAPAGEEDSTGEPLLVEKAEGLAEDFILGMDISSLIAELESGVTYRDFEGNVLSDAPSFCRFLAGCGVSHIRVRIWNDPYDADGNGYGGGSCDVNKAVQLAQACAEAGLAMIVDFHCSDFWADPGKQQAPKAWAGYTLKEKEAAVGTFVADTLARIRSTGVVVDMVQIGNETNGAFAGETSSQAMCALFSAGAAAVRGVDPAIRVVIHVTNPEKSTMPAWAKTLADGGVDYDVLATSYYPYWHGTLENLKQQLSAVQTAYGKQVLVAETSYAYTPEDSDGHPNTIDSGSSGGYPFTPQGQADFVRALIAAVSEAGGLGVCYWEPAWITVGDTTGLTGAAYSDRLAKNKAMWEQFGSGWAASFAAGYDPDDAGNWYGGSAMDNQAFFYPDGSPVESLRVWRAVRAGAAAAE